MTYFENMPDELCMPNGGVQTIVPQLAVPQYVYLDFDGAVTSYRNRDLDIFIDDIEVEDSGFDAETITLIVSTLNAQFEDDIVFTADLLQANEYSTVYIGKTSAFDDYGSFLGLAETIDSGNQIRNDNAFVFLNSTADLDTVVSVIAHETKHIVCGMEHGGEGVERYATEINVIKGKSSSGYTISSMQSMNVCGLAISTKVNSGGDLFVHSGGTANQTTVNSGGDLFVLIGGTANQTTVNSDGHMWVSIDGVAKSTTVNGGYLYLSSGGVVSGTTVNSGGYIYVSSGGVASGTTVNGGYLYLSSGGTALNIVWTPCVGKVMVVDGASATFVSHYKGCYYGSGNILLSNGMTLDNKIVSGSMYVFNSGIASSTIVNNGGHVYVSSGGVANSITVDSGGSLSVSSGGTATGIIVSSGGTFRLTVAPETYIHGSMSDSNFEMKNAFISGYTLNINCDLSVSSGGVANSTTVNSGGNLHVDGGVASGTTVNSGGSLYVSSGGVASGTTVNSGG